MASFAPMIIIRNAIILLLCAVVICHTSLYNTIFNTTTDQLPTTCWENTRQSTKHSNEWFEAQITGHVHGGLDGNIISQLKKVGKVSMKFQKMMGLLFHAWLYMVDIIIAEHENASIVVPFVKIRSNSAGWIKSSCYVLPKWLEYTLLVACR